MVRTDLFSGVTVAHGGLLLALLCWGLWRLRRDLAAMICASFVVVWTDLVVTALLLGSVGQLGDRLAYVGVSLILALVFALALRRTLPPAVGRLAYRSDVDPRFDASLFVRAIFWLIILAVVIPTAMLCIGYDPDNFDSIAYRLPRAFFYIGQGTLRHFPGGDFRMQYYPFNMTLAYLATAHPWTGRTLAQWVQLFGVAGRRLRGTPRGAGLRRREDGGAFRGDHLSHDAGCADISEFDERRYDRRRAPVDWNPIRGTMVAFGQQRRRGLGGHGESASRRARSCTTRFSRRWRVFSA